MILGERKDISEFKLHALVVVGRILLVGILSDLVDQMATRFSVADLLALIEKKSCGILVSKGATLAMSEQTRDLPAAPRTHLAVAIQSAVVAGALQITARLGQASDLRDDAIA